MQATDAIFFIAVLIMSVVIHEISHGFMAEYFGDKTARLAGRLTLNPIKHLDLFGSIIVPVLLFFSTGFVIGWAKPVPYNPFNFTNKKWGTIAVAGAGILANLLVAIIFGLILRFSAGFEVPEGFDFIVTSIIKLNIALALFNLVPIPPLDGSKILFQILPEKLHMIEDLLEQYSFVFLLLFIFFLFDYLYPVMNIIYYLLTGQ